MTTKNFKITIIIPTWNSEKYIGRAISSIRNNNYDNLEVLVMDNLSTDSTKDIVNSFQDERIRVISEKDTGMYEALNRGIRKSTGEIIGWIGADDFYQCDTLKNVSRAFSRHKTGWIIGDGNYIYEGQGSTRLIPQKLPRYANLVSIVKNNFVISPSSFFKRSLFDLVGGFDDRYKLAADLDLWLRFIQIEQPVIINQILSNFSFNGSNASCARRKEMLVETVHILNSVKNPLLRPLVFFQVARIYRHIILLSIREKLSSSKTKQKEK